MIEEFLLHLPFCERGRFLWMAEVCAIMWNHWGKRNNRVFRGSEREPSDVMFGLLLSSVNLFGLRLQSSFITILFCLIDPP